MPHLLLAVACWLTCIPPPAPVLFRQLVWKPPVVVPTEGHDVRRALPRRRRPRPAPLLMIQFPLSRNRGRRPMAGTCWPPSFTSPRAGGGGGPSARQRELCSRAEELLLQPAYLALPLRTFFLACSRRACDRCCAGLALPAPRWPLLVTCLCQAMVRHVSGETTTDPFDCKWKHYKL